jgi:hypothetical protein
MFCRSLFVLLYFFFWPLVVCSSSIYGFWLPLWYLQTLLSQVLHHNRDHPSPYGSTVSDTQLSGDDRSSPRLRCFATIPFLGTTHSYLRVSNFNWHKHKQVFITAPNRSKSYQNDMNKNCLEELPDMTRRT